MEDDFLVLNIREYIKMEKLEKTCSGRFSPVLNVRKS